MCLEGPRPLLNFLDGPRVEIRRRKYDAIRERNACASSAVAHAKAASVNDNVPHILANAYVEIDGAQVDALQQGPVLDVVFLSR